MASFVKRYTFVPGAASSAEVNQNFDDIADFFNNDVVHVDGSKTMTAPLALPATDPTADNQAARKAYVDSKVAAATVNRLQLWGVGTSLLAGWSGQQPLVQAGSQPVTLDGGGNSTIILPTAFPNGIITIIASDGDATVGGSQGSGLSFSVYNNPTTAVFAVNVRKANGAVAAGVGVRVNYIALGF